MVKNIYLGIYTIFVAPSCFWFVFLGDISKQLHDHYARERELERPRQVDSSRTQLIIGRCYTTKDWLELNKLDFSDHKRAGIFNLIDLITNYSTR